MAKAKHVENAAELITEYINGLDNPGKEICKKLRQIILKADKNIIEDWKWGPNYFYKGMLCGFGGFKKHVALAFFQGGAMKDPEKMFVKTRDGIVHNRRIYFYSKEDINEKIITRYVKEAVALNERGVKLVTKDKTVIIPADLKKQLIKEKLLKQFEATSYYNKKEYAGWINEAKREETRAKRIATAVEMIAAGKGLHDKYKK